MKKALLITTLFLLAAACNRSTSTNTNTSQPASEFPPNSPGTSGFLANYKDASQADGITVLSPKQNESVSSTFNIDGYGLSPFEGQSGLAEVLDQSGTLIGKSTAPLRPFGDSYPPAPYLFTGTMKVSAPANATGYIQATLQIINENPSGLAQNKKAIRIPIKIFVGTKP